MQTPPPPPYVPSMPNQPPQGSPQYPPPPKKKFPVWGIVLLSCGGCAVFGVVILAAILFPVFAQAREKARTVSCMSNMKLMSLGLLMYQQDYDERMPPAKVWMDTSVPYNKSEQMFHCPSVSAGDKQAYGYGFNSQLSQMTMEKLAKQGVNFATMPMIFESSKLGRNVSDPLTSLADPPRHGGNRGNNLAYLDGHVKFQSHIGFTSKMGD